MNKKFDSTLLLNRILAAPFVFCLLMVLYIIMAVHRFMWFMRYGGEMITFAEDERPTIYGIYNELRDARKRAGERVINKTE